MGQGSGGSVRWNVQSEWSVRASKEVALSPGQIERFVEDSLTEALDMAVEQTEPRRWRAMLARPLSLFDLCAVTVTVSGDPEDPTSKVEAEVSFDASSMRVGLAMGFTTSVIGAPVAWGWRFQSVRSAKAQAARIIERLWRALDARLVATTAYR